MDSNLVTVVDTSKFIKSCNFDSATLTWHCLQLRFDTNCNFGLVSTTICERGFSKQNWVRRDRRSRLKLETMDALM